MNNEYINFYNNLIKLTTNKSLYKGITKKQDAFSDRLSLFLFHFAFILKEFKNDKNEKILQKLYDFNFRQLELSIREIGYGDQSINKKMKDYINILYSIIDKIDKWEDLDSVSKMKVIKYFIDDSSFIDNYVKYFEKYIEFLTKNTFNSLSKDILSLEN